MCGHDLTAGGVFTTWNSQGAADQPSVSCTSEVGSEKAQRTAVGSKSHPVQACQGAGLAWTLHCSAQGIPSGMVSVVITDPQTERVCPSPTAHLDAQADWSPDEGEGTSEDPGRKGRLTQHQGDQTPSSRRI